MKAVLPDADVRDFEPHIAGLSLISPHDRHVVAAAIHARAHGILSSDRGFAGDALALYGIKLHRPDDLLMALYRDSRELLLCSLANARRNLSHSQPSPGEFVEGLRASTRLDEFCRAIEAHLSDI